MKTFVAPTYIILLHPSALLDCPMIVCEDNLGPRAFPLTNGSGGPSHFLAGKALGRAWYEDSKCKQLFTEEPFILVLLFLPFNTKKQATIGDKIVETLYSNTVTSENKRIHTPPLHSKLGCSLFSIGSSNGGTKLHGGDGGRKAFFPLLKSVKRQKPL